jgi:hypothetical protein
VEQLVEIDPLELEAAQERDAARARHFAGFAGEVRTAADVDVPPAPEKLRAPC